VPVPAPVWDAVPACTAAQLVWAGNPHTPAGPGTERKAAAADRGVVERPAVASAAAGSAGAAEEAVVGTAAAGWAAVDHIPAARAGSVAGETCGAHRYLPMPGAPLPAAPAAPDAAVAVAVDAVEAADLVAADALLDLVAPETRAHARAVAHSKPPSEVTAQLRMVMTRIPASSDGGGSSSSSSGQATSADEATQVLHRAI
jgi:ribonuclease E